MEIIDVRSRVAFAADKMQKTNLCETDRFFCDVYCLEPGQEQRPHSHSSNDKIYYMLEGEVEVLLGAERATLGPGRLALARAGVEHGVRNRSERRAVCLVFMAPHPGKPGTRGAAGESKATAP